MSKQRATYKITHNRIKIYIDDVLHICIPKDNNMKIQSWYEDSSLYKIEIYNVKHLDEYHYDNPILWRQILTILDEAL